MSCCMRASLATLCIVIAGWGALCGCRGLTAGWIIAWGFAGMAVDVAYFGGAAP